MGAENEDRVRALRELEHAFPGWQIWLAGDTWCAKPTPLINAASAEELAERIKTAHSRPPDGAPPLASWRSYRARARQFREFEKNAAETWLRMRAEADRRRRSPVRRRARQAQADGISAPPPVPSAADVPDVIA